jgi:hypothetical protein
VRIRLNPCLEPCQQHKILLFREGEGEEVDTKKNDPSRKNATTIIYRVWEQKQKNNDK